MIDSSLLPLSAEHVRLRQLEARDAEAFAGGSFDPLVREYGHLPQPNYTTESVLEMIRKEANPGLERGDLAVLAIADSNDSFAGSLVLFNVTEDEAEVGFWLHPNFRGLGLSISAVELSAELATRSGMVRLLARTAVKNIASQRVLVQTDFKEMTRSADIAPSGEQLDLIHFQRNLQTPTK
jgi:RimJ/RimL family protein N-acetyltransferase